jgi:hypothetical protein
MFNPQQQFPVKWPSHPYVALAYLDQLTRTNSLSRDASSELRSTLAQAKVSMDSKRRNRPAAAKLRALASNLSINGSDAQSSKRVAALRETLLGISERLD